MPSPVKPTLWKLNSFTRPSSCCLPRLNVGSKMCTSHCVLCVASCSNAGSTQRDSLHLIYAERLKQALSVVQRLAKPTQATSCFSRTLLHLTDARVTENDTQSVPADGREQISKLFALSPVRPPLPMLYTTQPGLCRSVCTPQTHLPWSPVLLSLPSFCFMGHALLGGK